LFPSKEKTKRHKTPRKKRPTPKEKTIINNSKTSKKDNQSSRSDHTKIRRKAIDTEKQEQRSKEDPEKDTENLSDELPDRFTKL